MNKDVLLKFISEQGYKNDSPDKDRPVNVIPSGRITMKDVDFPVHGVDNLGNEKTMYPGEEHQFPGDYVVETPVKKSKWEIVKDLKGMPSHKTGGVKLSVNNGGVRFVKGETPIHAKHGLIIAAEGIEVEKDKIENSSEIKEQEVIEKPNKEPNPESEIKLNPNERTLYNETDKKVVSEKEYRDLYKKGDVFNKLSEDEFAGSMLPEVTTYGYGDGTWEAQDVARQRMEENVKSNSDAILAIPKGSVSAIFETPKAVVTEAIAGVTGDEDTDFRRAIPENFRNFLSEDMRKVEDRSTSDVIGFGEKDENGIRHGNGFWEKLGNGSIDLATDPLSFFGVGAIGGGKNVVKALAKNPKAAVQFAEQLPKMIKNINPTAIVKELKEFGVPTIKNLKDAKNFLIKESPDYLELIESTLAGDAEGLINFVNSKLLYKFKHLPDAGLKSSNKKGFVKALKSIKNGKKWNDLTGKYEEVHDKYSDKIKNNISGLAEGAAEKLMDMGQFNTVKGMYKSGGEK